MMVDLRTYDEYKNQLKIKIFLNHAEIVMKNCQMHFENGN